MLKFETGSIFPMSEHCEADFKFSMELDLLKNGQSGGPERARTPVKIPRSGLQRKESEKGQGIDETKWPLSDLRERAHE